MYAKIVQIEHNTKYARIFLLLRCSLSYLKIVQIEDNTKYARIFLLLQFHDHALSRQFRRREHGASLIKKHLLIVVFRAVMTQ